MPTAIIPILFTVAIGFAIESYRRTEVRALSTIVSYVLLPCLIFTSLLTTEGTLGEALRPPTRHFLLGTDLLFDLDLSGGTRSPGG